MKELELTKIYTGILEGIGLKVDSDFFVKNSSDAEIVLEFDKKDHKLSVPNRAATEKIEPSDVVRFHPLGESIFMPPSNTVRFMVQAMESDLYIRILTIACKMVDLSEEKRDDADLTAKQVAEIRGIPYTKSAVKYFKQVAASIVNNKKPKLVSVTNKRGYVVDGVKHSRVCVVKTDPMKYTQETGVFNVPCDSKTSFKMVFEIFSKILKYVDIESVSNLKSSPTFISMLKALGTYSAGLNNLSNALWRTNDNPAYRNVDWAKGIDELPELYRKELPVQFLGNVDSKAVDEVVPVEEDVSPTIEPKKDTEALIPVAKKSLLPESATGDVLTAPEKIEEVPTESESVNLMPESMTGKNIINEITTPVNFQEVIQETPKENNMLSNPVPRKRLGSQAANMNSNQTSQGSNSIFDNQQQQNNQLFDNQQQINQFQQNNQVQFQQQNNQVQQSRIVSDEEATASDASTEASLRAVSNEPAARENATSCHAFDFHNKQLFRYDGSAYMIKGNNPKLNLIHKSDANGVFLFKQNGDPILGPLTYNADGTMNGIRNVGTPQVPNRVGQQQNQQNQQQNQQNMSLAQRLNAAAGNNSGAIFNNQQQQTNFAAVQLTDSQINQLLRQGIPEQNIRQFMITGNKEFLNTQTSVGLGLNTNSGLPQSDRERCYKILMALYNSGVINEQTAIKVKQALTNNTLSVEDARKLVKMGSNANSSSSSIFDEPSGLGMSDTII